jgi:hypothetical protein
MAYYFFPPTRVAVAQISELFDFVWPTAAALWNLRWQVSGFLQEVPESSPVQLNDRFVFGSKIHGTNLKKACVETTWEAQKHQMSGILLTNAFAVYEHWADEILACVGKPGGKGRLLQFDDVRGGKLGLAGTVKSICATESRTLKAAYYPVFCGSPKYSWPLMKNLIACYRFYKELRNSQIHNGGVASKLAADAYAAFAPVSDKASLGMRGDLIHDPISEGDKIALHLRGVVGFCDILFRMMVTVDAELCRSKSAEDVLERKFRSARKPSTLSSRANRRHAQILNYCKAAGLPKPVSSEIIRAYLISKNFVTI